MRRIVLTLGFTSVIVSGLLAGCEVESPDLPPDEATKNDEDPILGGSVDTVHDAVVLLLSQSGFQCTGTIISKNQSTGYVLTAAHCDGMDFVIMDDNVSCINNNSCDGVWEVNLQTDHPMWNPNDVAAGYDFSLIRFSGATASTPVIPAAQPLDGITAGTVVDLVGYGVTENGSTDLRMHVMQPVNQVTSNPPFLVFDQTGGTGTCSGDSGGPAIFNGEVVGVTSFGDEGCNEVGVSGRVASVYNEFIAPFIGGQVTETCDTCFDAEVNQAGGTCNPQVEACFTPEDSQCAQLVQCFNGCSTQACYDACADTHSGGITQFNAIIDCACTACATLCADDCNPGTSATSISVSSSGTGVTSAGGASGVGGDGSGATSSDGGSGGGGGDNAEDDGAGGPCDCATAGSSDRAPNGGALAIAGLALALGALRGHRRGRRRR